MRTGQLTQYRGLCVECRVAWKNSLHCNSCGADDLIAVSPKFRVPRRSQLGQWRKISQGNLNTKGHSMDRKLGKQYRDPSAPDLFLPREQYRFLKRKIRSLEHIGALKQINRGSLSLEVSPGITREEVRSFAALIAPMLEQHLHPNPYGIVSIQVYGEGTLAVARGLAPQAPRRKRWWAVTQEAVENFQEWFQEELRGLLPPGMNVTFNYGVIQVMSPLPAA